MEINGQRLEEDLDTIIQSYETILKERTEHHMGYPYNLDFDFGCLNRLQKYCINNLGDPFIESNYGVHSRDFEIAVIDWFARLWDIAPDDYWGYVTNCGTEGNLHGILLGRENFPDGILYTSADTHYSVFKAARMYRMQLCKIRSQPSGEMDYDDFKTQLQKNPRVPAIVNVNIGTTVKGAVDDINRILETLSAVGFDNNRFYIHCDGALFGMMLPFIDLDHTTKQPKVSFSKDIGSISVSGHKFVGSPVPCGVLITRKRYVAALASDIEYLNSRDATIMGSRNGHAPIYMWYTLCKKGIEQISEDVRRCLDNARLLLALLKERGIRCMLNDLSSTVVFDRPTDVDFVKKWQLACEGDNAHVVVMPNITREKLTKFAEEIVHAYKK